MSKIVALVRLVMALLPEPVVWLLYTGRRERLGDLTMDAKAQAVGRFANTVRVPGQLPTVDESRAQLQKIADLFDRPAPAVLRKLDIAVDGRAGDLRARVYDDGAEGAPPRPVLVFYHGGGWIQGSIESHDKLCEKLAKWSGAIVISVAYRLAPEAPFPAAVEDALAAYAWVRENAGRFGGDRARVGVGGDSAGGNLAAVVCHQSRQANLPMPHFQILIYPAVDGRMGSPSMNELRDAYVIPRDRMEWYKGLYLGPADPMDTRFSPLLEERFDDLPQAYVVTGGFDPLRSEGRDYADHLRAAGVETDHRLFPGQIHGFVNLTRPIPQGTRCIREIAEWMKGL